MQPIMCYRHRDQGFEECAHPSVSAMTISALGGRRCSLFRRGKWLLKGFDYDCGTCGGEATIGCAHCLGEMLAYASLLRELWHNLKCPDCEEGTRQRKHVKWIRRNVNEISFFFCPRCYVDACKARDSLIGPDGDLVASYLLKEPIEG